MQIPGLRGLSPVELIKQSIKEFLKDDMLTYASALAYQVFFSIFPFIIFLVALLGFFHIPDFFDWLRQQAEAFMPQQSMQQLNEVITQLQTPQGGLLSFGVVIAMWTASSAVRATMNAMNRAYDVTEGRPAWKLYPLSIVYTIAIAAVMMLAAGFFILGPQAANWIAQHLGLERLFVLIWNIVRWPIVVLLLTVAAAVVYYVAPDVEQDFRFITPGAALAVIVWIVASLGFDFYVRTFADYNKTYGSIGTIIVILFYFFITAAVMLFGAEMNAVIEHHAADGKAPGQKEMPS